MSKESMYGFALVLAGFVFKIVSKALGIDGNCETATNSLISLGLAFLVGKAVIDNRGGNKKGGSGEEVQ